MILGIDGAITGRKHVIKKASLVVGIATFALSSAASAQDVRPSALNFQRTATVVGAPLPAPAKPIVRKRNELAPAVIVLIVVVTVGTIGGIAAAVSGGSPS